jgi:hypothetical protein
MNQNFHSQHEYYVVHTSLICFPISYQENIMNHSRKNNMLYPVACMKYKSTPQFV